MSDQHDETGPDAVDDPRLSPEGRRALARLRKAKAEAKAAGRWQTEPMDDPDGKFSGPFGVDEDGRALIYHTDEEARRALEEHERKQRRSVAEQLRRRAELREPGGGGGA
jgi:hypothetical protein